MRAIWQGLRRTREVLASGFGKIDLAADQTAWLGDIEVALIKADAGVTCAKDISKRLRESATTNQNFTKLQSLDQLKFLNDQLSSILTEKLTAISASLPFEPEPFVVLVMGVNGSGKTTSIAKLARYAALSGRSVMVVGADTFRAAAREQLDHWVKRIISNADNQTQAQELEQRVHFFSAQSTDPATVAYQALEKAKAMGVQVIFIDTAGRLPNQPHLLAQLQKVDRAIAKIVPGAPHERMLILDANIGNNAHSQIELFNQALKITGTVVTKLDGSARGGIILSLCHGFDGKPRPLRYIGVGEGADDLLLFNPKHFVDNLLA